MATATFIARGYRLTQMSDIAEAAGIAKGTVYLYVESKEALFDTSVRCADEAFPLVPKLPVRTPEPGATVAYIRERIAAEAKELTLAQVVSGTVAITNARRELLAVVSDLFHRVARSRLAMLVDRCAADYPELASVWFGEARWAQHHLLVKLIELGASQKHFRNIANPGVVARTILETITFWAMHRHFDQAPRVLDDGAVEASVVDFVVHSLLASSGPRDSERIP